MAQFWRLGKSEVRCHIDDMPDISGSPLKPAQTPPAAGRPAAPSAPPGAPQPHEIGGPKGPEPTRYGDWEVNGRCSDF
jgi:hypothetical protein